MTLNICVSLCLPKSIPAHDFLGNQNRYDHKQDGECHQKDFPDQLAGFPYQDQQLPHVLDVLDDTLFQAHEPFLNIEMMIPTANSTKITAAMIASRPIGIPFSGVVVVVVIQIGPLEKRLIQCRLQIRVSTVRLSYLHHTHIVGALMAVPGQQVLDL
jgi:hypothetical protein